MRHRDRLKKWINRLKSKPCTDCGESYPPVVMDFDHLEPERKRHSISRMVRAEMSRRRIEREIAKCQLVCANCHRIRTSENDHYRNRC